MKIKKILQLIFLLSLFSLILSQEEITVNDELDRKTKIENKEKRSKKFDYKIFVKDTYRKFIIFRTYDNKQNYYMSPMHILFHNTQIPDESNYERASAIYHENILVVYQETTKEFYISVVCPRECDGYLTYYASEHIHLNINEHFEFFGGNDYIIAFKKENILRDEGIQLVLLGPQVDVDHNSMQIFYYDKNTQERVNTDDYPMKGLLIKNTELSYVLHANSTKYENADKYIFVSVNGPSGHFMRFQSRHIGFGKYYVGEPAIYSLKSKPSDYTTEECIEIIGARPRIEYQFRLLTTTSLKLRFKNSEENDIVGYLQDYYKKYTVNSEGEVKTFCFVSNETTTKFIRSEPTDKQAFYFQIVTVESNTIESMIEPLYEGFRYFDLIPTGQSRFYRHARWTNYKTNIYITSNAGTLNAYQVVCTTFPYCSDFSKYKNVKKLIYGFSAFVASIDPNLEHAYGSPKQVLHVVTCMEENGCYVSVRFMDQEGLVYLGQNQNHAKFIEYNVKEDYLIHYTSFEQNKLEINLDVFAGDVVLEFNNEVLNNYPHKYLFFGTSQKYIFDGNKLVGKNITVTVSARKNSFYVLSHKAVAPNEERSRIGESGLLLQAIKGDNTEFRRYFNFWHNSPSKDNAFYVVNFLPINCEIDVFHDNENPEEPDLRKLSPNFLGHYEDILTESNPDFYELSPVYYVRFNKFKHFIPKDNYCLFYVGASESSKELPTLLRENAPYFRTLSNKVRKASFVWPYPFPYRIGDADIKINLRNEVRIKIKVTINNDTEISTRVISRSSIFEIPSSQLDQCQGIVGCPILVELELENPDTNDKKYPIEISISNTRKTPFFLQKGIFRRAGVNDNSTDYYYIDVEAGESGEIILDLKRGSGFMFAKLVKKNAYLDPNQNPNAWAQKVNLPTATDYDKRISYDPCTQKIKYDSKLTLECEKGCFIVFGVATKDNFTEFQSLFNFEYSIIARYIEKGVNNLDKIAVNVPINEFIVGALEDTYENEYFDTFKFDSNENYKGLEIEFKAAKVNLYISWETDYLQKGCLISPDENVQIIRLNPGQTCGSNTLPQLFNGVEFKLSAYTSEFEKGVFSPYYFRIRPIYEDRPHIIELDSDKETTCTTGDDNKCYFMIPLYSYDDVSTLVLYADTEGVNDVVFYGRTVKSEAYDSCKIKSCFEDFLARETDKSSSNQENTKHIEFKAMEFSKDDYILVTVKSLSGIKKIPVASSFKTYADATSPTHNYIQVLYIRPEHSQSIILDEHTLNITVIHLNGKGEIQMDSKSHQIVAGNSLVLETQGKKGELKLINKEQNDFIIALKYKYSRGAASGIYNLVIDDEIGKYQEFESINPTIYQFNVTVNTNNKYTILRTYANEGNEAGMHILFSSTEIPTIKNFERASNLYLENIMVIKTDYTKKFYITVSCPGNCNGRLTYYTSNKIHIGLNEHFEFIGGGEAYNLVLKRDSIPRNEYIQVVLLGPQLELKNEYMQIGVMNEDETYSITEISDKGILIKDMELSKVINPNKDEYLKHKYIYIRVSGPPGHYMRFMNRRIGHGIYKAGDPAMYILKNDKKNMFEEECVTIVGRKNIIYQFRLTTTYALSLRINGNITKNIENYMQDYITYYALTENSQSNLCFKSLEKTKIRGNEIETTKQAFYFQVIIGSGTTLDSVIEPFYEGWTYYDQLSQHETRFYRHAKWTNQKTNTYITSKSGALEVYQVTCTTFPYCWFLSDMKNVTKLIYAFSAYVSSINPNDETHYGDANQVVHLVSCLDSLGCGINVRYYSQVESIKLLEYENHAKYIMKGEKENYQIDTASIDSKYEKIEISLDIFAGDVTIGFHDPILEYMAVDHIFYGTSEKYIYDIKDIRELQMKFSINANKNSYYVISYRNIDLGNEIIKIGESGLLFQAMKGEFATVRQYQFFHNCVDKKNTSYVVNFIPVNCEIEVINIDEQKRRKVLIPNSLGIYEYIMSFDSDEEYKNVFPLYELSFKQFKRQKPIDNYCYFYVGASESSQGIPTLLRENIPYSRTLSKKNPLAFMVWPYPYIEGDAEIKVNIESDYNISYVVLVNNDILPDKIGFTRSTLIELSEGTLKDCKYTNGGCQILFGLLLETEYINTDVSVPVEVSLTNKRKTPSILQKGVMRRSGSNDNSTNYYYLEVQRGEEGEILLDFKRGNGIMFAKLVTKSNDSPDFDAWRGKVVLPTEKDHDPDLVYNPITQKIRYSVTQTNKCEHACFIVFGVISKDHIGAFQNIFSSEYNIIARYSEYGAENLAKVAVYISMNEFVHGTVNDLLRFGYYDVYNLVIYDNLYGIEIEFKSNKATMYISWENDYPSNSPCSINPGEKVTLLRLTKNSMCGRILPNLFKDKIFKFVVSTNEFETGLISPYYFRVRPIYYEQEPNVIEVLSDKETVCQTVDNYCYFMIPLNSHDDISTIVLYTVSQGENDITYYIKSVYSHEYEKCNHQFSCINNLFPRQEGDGVITSRSKFITADGLKYDKNYYILITIRATRNQLLTLASSMKTYIHSTDPKSSNIQLAFITPSNKRRYNIKPHIKYIYVTHLLGKGILNFQDNNYTINQGIKTLENRGTNATFTIINNDQNDNLILAIQYLQVIPPITKEIVVNNERGRNELIYSEVPGMFQYQIIVQASGKYVIFRTYLREPNSGPLHIFMSPSDFPTPNNFELGSYSYHENIIVVKKENWEKFYITVNCPEKCNGNLTYYSSDHIHINPNDHFEFLGSSESYNLVIKRESIPSSDSLQLILLGPQFPLSVNDMQIGTVNNLDESIEKTDQVSQGELIANNELSIVIHPNNPKYNNRKYIYIRVRGPYGQFLRFQSRHIGASRYYIGDPAVYVIKTNREDMNKEDCIDILGEKEGEIYSFRLVPTYSVYMTINGIHKATSSFMKNYETTYTVSKENPVTHICFKANETTNVEGTVRRTPKLAFYFQVVNSDTNSINSLIEPLYEGWVYNDNLNYRQKRIYRHAKWTSEKTNLYLISNVGTINAYQVKCTTFPYCLDSTTYQNVSKLIYAFSAFVSSIDPKEETYYGGSKQIINIVECMTEGGCTFSLHYKDQESRTQLKENENHGKFIRAGEREGYYFSALNLESNYKLEINLDVFAGDAVLSFSSEMGYVNYKHIFVGSSEKYILEPSDVKDREVVYSIIAKSNSYYATSFRILEPKDDSSNIGEGGLLLQFLNEENLKSRDFQFWHNMPYKQNVPYVANFIPINCILSVKFKSRDESEERGIKNNSLGVFEDVTTSSTDPSTFGRLDPIYSVKFNGWKGQAPSDKNCYFYVGASESSNEHPTLLREDLVYSRTLTQFAKSASFIWPFPFTPGNALIKINLRNEFSIRANVSVNNGTFVSSYIFSKSAIFEISEKDLAQCADAESCSIMLTLELFSNMDLGGSIVPVEVSLTTGRGTPIMLPKGVLIRGGFNDNTTTYYYLEIAKEEEGEIVLDFKRGSGIMFAKMVSKDDVVVGPKAWREKLILPTENDHDKELEYNYATQKIKYKKSYTEKCGGICFIIVGVTSKFKFEGYEAYFASEYNIMVRNPKKGIKDAEKNSINIPINEFISGSIQEKNDYYDTYSLEFMKNYRGFELEFKSEKAEIILSFGNEYLTKGDCGLPSGRDIQIVRYKLNDDCGQTKVPYYLKEKKLRITVKSTTNKDDYIPYYFRIRPILEGERSHIIEINSDKETACFGEVNSLCYFMVPLYSWDGVSNIVLYANTHNEDSKDITFYYKKVASEEYDRCDDRECWNRFIADDRANSSITQVNTKYVIIKGIDLLKTDYIMVSIKTKNKQIVPIVSSIKNYYNSMISKPNYAQLIYMYAQEKRLVAINEYISQVKVIYITGQGDVSINLFKYELPPITPINVLTHRLKSHIEIENKEEGHFLIALEYNYQEKVNLTKITVTPQRYQNKLFFAEGPQMFNYEVELAKEVKDNYVIFRTYASENGLGDMHLLMHESEVPSPAKNNFSSSLYHENIIAVKTRDGKNRHFYITVVCPEKCKGNLTYYSTNYIHMDANDHFEFIGGDSYTLAFLRERIDQSQAIQLVLLGPQLSLDKEYLKIGYGQDDGQIIITQDIPKQGLLINGMELSYILHPSDNKYKGKYIFVRVGGLTGHYMRFMSRHIGNGKYHIGDPAVYSLKDNKTDYLNTECVEILGAKLGQIYEFRLITTYGLNLLIDGRVHHTTKYMEDYLSDFSITNTSKVHNICFNSTQFTDRGGRSEETLKQAFYFQIVKTDVDSIKAVIEPLYEGWIYKEKIFAGQSRFYRHAKYTPQKTNVYIQGNNGDINVYQVKCTSFPYCHDSGLYQNVSKLIYAFSHFVSSINPEEEKHYGDSQQVIHVVKCLSTRDCDVTIEYYDTYSEINFKENENHAKFLEKGGTETYQFKPLPLSDSNVIEVNLDVFSGDCVIQFDTEKLQNTNYKYIFFGNSEKYIFPASKVKGQTIKFWVRAKINSYYVISYRDVEISNEYSRIGESGFLLQSIKNDRANERFFTFWHNNPSKNDVPYIFNLIPINCHVDVYYKNKTSLKPNSLGHYEDIYTSETDSELFSLHQLDYSVKFKEFSQNEPNDKYCHFYIGASESSKQVPTLLRESMVYTRTLSDKVRSAVFVLPYTYARGDIDIKINMKNSYKMKANITLNDELISQTTFTRSALLEVSEGYLMKCETVYGCPITISLELAYVFDLGDTVVPIEIVVSSPRKMPSILQKGVFRRTGINANTTDYYYIEVEKDEEGEIILDIKRGTGIMFAKLVNKTRESDHEDAWRRKVILPNETHNDVYLPYNPITQKIRFEKKHTFKCNNGCFLVFGVKSKEDHSGYENIFTQDYTIFARYINLKESDLNKVAVNIPVNEYIIGSLENTEKQGQKDAYIIDLYDNYDGLEIEFNSDNGILKYGLSDNFKEVNKFSNIVGIREPLIRKVTFNQNEKTKGKQFRMVVYTENLGNYKTTQYTLKVRPILKNRPHLLEINSDKPIICNAKSDDICNFYLPLSTFDSVSDLVVYADAKHEIDLYYSVTSSDYFGNCDYTRCFTDVLPSKYRYIQSSELQKNKNYLFINTASYQKDDILLFSITTRAEQKISLFSSLKSFVFSTIPTPNTLQIIDVIPFSDQSIILNDAIKTINVTYIQGIGKLKYDKNYDFNVNSKNFIINKANNNNIFKVENTDPSQHLILTLSYVIDNKKINPIRPDLTPDIPDPVPGKKDDKKSNTSGISPLLIFALFLILVAVGLAVAWKLLKVKQEKDKFKQNVDQLSITLSGKEIENQKQPLLNENNELNP